MTRLSIALLFFFCACALSPFSAFAAGDVKGPLAVVALIDGHEDSLLARLAGAVQHELAAGGKIEVLSAERTAVLLSGGGQAGPAAEGLERLEGIFQQGYLQSYSFQYAKALSTLKRVQEGIARLPVDAERWRLWIKTKIFQGISLAGLKKEDQALQCFAVVLRTRPEMELSRQDYSPKTIRLWDKARKRLGGLPQGQLAVESDPPGAEILLDGQQIAKTPFIGSYPQGRYHLQVLHPKTGGAQRWVEVGEQPVRVRFQLSFEGAIALDLAYPCVRLPAGADKLPAQWWPWLGERLGLRYLVAVRRRTEKGRAYLAASLVDLERGRKLREGWLEYAGSGPEEVAGYAADLSGFLVTGKAKPPIEARALPKETARPEPAEQQLPELPVHYAPRPWYRSWWPYTIAAGVMLGVGLGTTLGYEGYMRDFNKAVTEKGKDAAKQNANACLGVAITSYVLAGAAALTAIIAPLTYRPKEIFTESSLLPSVGPTGAGIVWVGRF
ncbi:MAG TPA: PEGA domain-containing protein [Myxococcota bacterium]|nr:PEGA domain-containing protein [Myxococcota bacterium]